MSIPNTPKTTNGIIIDKIAHSIKNPITPIKLSGLERSKATEPANNILAIPMTDSRQPTSAPRFLYLISLTY